MECGVEEVVLKIFISILFGGFTFATGYRGDTNGSDSSFPTYPTAFQPTNYVTINACSCNEEYNNLQDQIQKTKEALNHLVSELETKYLCNPMEWNPTTRELDKSYATTLIPVTTGKDCLEIQQDGGRSSGVYRITPENSPPFEVYCDMETDGGGWTVFQRRVDDSVDFYRFWDDYKTGFGSLEGNHWLGNDHLYYITNQEDYALRVEMRDFENSTRYAVYDFFRITDESGKYTLTLGTYSGNAGDAMAVCNGRRFSTQDDNAGNGCPHLFSGAWWYSHCHEANPNGLYLGGPHDSYADGIEWNQWKGYYYSLKFIELKLRPT